MTGKNPNRKGRLRNCLVQLYSLLALATVLGICTSGFAQDIESFDGSRGFWIRGHDAEAFVAVEPVFRVAALRRPGTPSMMADSTAVEKGLRLAFMGPNQVPASFNVGDQPATVIERSPASAKLRLASSDNLSYTVNLSFDAQAARVRLEYELVNIGEAARKIACWSVISLAGDGTIIAPFGVEPKARRRLVLPWWTPWPQPSYRFERDTMAVGVSAQPVRNCKVGLISDAGWVAVRTGNQILVSSVTFDRSAGYPEDGANITIFQTAEKGRMRCEIEQVGPLQDVLPGKACRMVETLDLFEVAEPAPPDGSPDVLRKQVEAAAKARPDPKSD